MSVWGWIGLVVVVQLTFPLLWPKRYANGSLTRLWRRCFRRPTDPRLVRSMQLAGLIPVVFLLARPMFQVCILVLYLDDYFTGDTDEWKRRWDAVKNRIKWKMELPVSARSDA